MKNRKLSQNHQSQVERKKTGNSSVRAVISVSVCALAALAVSAGGRFVGSERDSEVYAASEEETGYALEGGSEYDLPTGIAGIASGIRATPAEGSEIYRIGTSCEHVVVGQRVQKVRKPAEEIDLSIPMAAAVNDLDSKMVSMSSSAKMMSDEDYENLLKIVEAEAGTEDIKGRVLIANVIMNRVRHPEFPDNITDVIWEYDNGVPQFSPVADGRIGEVTVTDETREAVKQALEGTDYSEGALFFIQKSAAEKHNIAWFEKDLTKLFKHGVHEFYTYPEEAPEDKKSEKKSQKKAGKKSDQDSGTELVQMVKAE
ncbi:cell wall hydrolase [Blautia sp.]|jgi:N-acetylmuramoyl-L-alanine amidase|uniref:cell wall hydrolase n=1 Tax=Blautia sp. TaxID=1955243 RepID=UPI00280A9211|nr:cell wall hydrolase [uncultured Blautia sp.]